MALNTTESFGRRVGSNAKIGDNSDMTKAAIISGVVLMGIGIAGYVHGVRNDRASLTALIPAAIGGVLFLLGLLAAAKENLRKHLMHAAVLVALIGSIATAARLIPRLGEFDGSAAQLSQLSTAIVCLIFVILAIRSFINARRSTL